MTLCRISGPSCRAHMTVLPFRVLPGEDSEEVGAGWVGSEDSGSLLRAEGPIQGAKEEIVGDAKAR